MSEEYIFLTPGNGNQRANKRIAMDTILFWLKGAEKINDGTINAPIYGRCHVGAYTDPKCAMIATTDEDNGYGSQDWHNSGFMFLFRDSGEGMVHIYLCETKVLFELRDIGRAGVRWSHVREAAVFYLETGPVELS